MGRRGLAYSCGRCPGVVGEKSRVELHYLRNHLTLEQVPYHCGLCLYRCCKLADLEGHGNGYKPHIHQQAIQKRLGICLPDSAYFRTSSTPYIPTPGLDVIPMSREASRIIWEARPTRKPAVQKAEPEEPYIPTPIASLVRARATATVTTDVATPVTATTTQRTVHLSGPGLPVAPAVPQTDILRQALVQESIPLGAPVCILSGLLDYQDDHQTLFDELPAALASAPQPEITRPLITAVTTRTVPVTSAVPVNSAVPVTPAVPVTSAVPAVLVTTEPASPSPSTSSSDNSCPATSLSRELMEAVTRSGASVTAAIDRNTTAFQHLAAAMVEHTVALQLLLDRPTEQSPTPASGNKENRRRRRSRSRSRPAAFRPQSRGQPKVARR